MWIPDYEAYVYNMEKTYATLKHKYHAFPSLSNQKIISQLHERCNSRHKNTSQFF